STTSLPTCHAPRWTRTACSRWRCPSSADVATYPPRSASPRRCRSTRSCWTPTFRVSDAFFFFQAEDGIRDRNVTGVQTCALPISVRLPGDAGLAFLASGTNGERGLFVMRADGSHVHRLALLEAEQFTWAAGTLPR